MMLLALDIGNSSISLGIFDTQVPQDDSPALVFTGKLSSDTGRTADEYIILLRGLLGARTSDITEAVMGSVVPQLTHTLEAAVRRLCGDALPILHMGGGVRSGIHLRVDDPAALGADIVTNAAAAARLCGTPVIFFDYGTATVCGAVNAARELIGVIIAPGVQTSLEGLRAAAAQIPYLELKPPEALLGKNTSASIRSGLITGTACMTDELIGRLRTELCISPDSPLPIVATGGLAPLVLPHCRHSLRHEPALTLMGLCFIHGATRERATKHAKHG